MRAWLQNLRAGLYLALFRRPATVVFHPGAQQFIALVATSLVVSGAWSFVLAGDGGVFDPQALSSELLWVPLALLAGYAVSRVMQNDAYVLLIAVAVGSIGITLTFLASAIWFVAQHGWIEVASEAGFNGIYHLIFIWWALATVVAVKRMAVPGPGRAISPALVVTAVVLLPAYLLPPVPLWSAGEYADEVRGQTDARRLFGEDALYAQAGLLRNAERRLKAGRPDMEDLYFVGFAPYASQDVFMKETVAISKLLEDRFDVAGRSISLISNPGAATEYPMATLTSLRHVLREVGRRMDPDEDVVLLHVTSHGSEDHALSVNFDPLALRAIRPADLRAALDDAGIKWRIVVISACYSGGFIDALKDDHTLVMTASDATHTSFGCGDAFNFTYFSQAYFDEALRRTYSFEQAFDAARQAIAVREQREGLEASNPQISLGKAMHIKLTRLEKRLSSQQPAEKADAN
ncbi:MAG: C13 family peptidase [Betaproteobacteria bacterium]